MKNIEEIAGMIAIRNHLSTLRERGTIAKKDYQEVNTLINQLDQETVAESLALFRQVSAGKVKDDLNISQEVANVKAARAKKLAALQGSEPSVAEILKEDLVQVAETKRPLSSVNVSKEELKRQEKKALTAKRPTLVELKEAATNKIPEESSQEGDDE